MQITIRGLVALASGEYGDDVTRKDGSKVRYIDLYDPTANADNTVRVTIGQDVDPKTVPVLGTKVDVDAVLARRDGRWKFRADAIRVVGQADLKAA